MQIHQAILDALEEGINIELTKDAVGFQFEMNTGAKSDMQIRPRADGRLDVFQRYNEENVVDTFDEICDLVREGMFNTKHVAECWEKALKKRDLL
jgi:hypothetical protein